MVKHPQNEVDSLLITPTAAATTALTARLDCKDAHYATIRVALGIEANTNSTNVVVSLLESDDTVVTNFATFDSDLADTTVDNTAAVVATRHVDLDGRKRYLRLTVTPDTTTNGAVTIGAVASLCKSVRSGTASDYGNDVARG